MNGGKSDASTSTDDVKDRPLCLFYFTHPFGVLSPEPPVVSATPPPGVVRAFLNMQPLSPLYWAAAPSPTEEPCCRAPSPRAPDGPFELGGAQVHARPLSVHAAWLPRRGALTRMLPPLRLPAPPHLSDCGGAEDAWPRSGARCLPRFSLPPIELPRPLPAPPTPPAPPRADSARVRDLKCVHALRLGVRKARRGRRARGGDVHRMITCLMRRAITGAGSGDAAARSRGETRGGCGSPAPALQRALATIRDAWAEPASLRQRCRITRPMYPQNYQSGERENRIEERSSREWNLAAAAMLTRTRSPRAQHAQHAPAQPAPARADASPGLLRRRYSVPETVMRKYRLAQQSSDTESECGGCLSAGGAAGEAPRPPRRDRELMRKSALLRRMWARAPPPAACACDVRSLPASRDELHASCTLSSCPDTACAPSEGSAPATAPAPASPEESATSAGHAPFSSERLVCDGTAPYELLEIVVSESASSSPPERGAGSTPPTCPAPPRPAPAPPIDIDEYVSRVLVESLNSLTDRLEGMNASVGADRKLSVVEKEIKVRLQNAAVNTIVHLSPTSNHQIIFGNEELCGRAALAPPALPPAEERDDESPRGDAFDAVDQQEGVNRAVLRQIQQLFREDLRPEEGAGVSLAEGAPLSAVGAGNYYRPLQRAALVPRRTALPHSASMEVNTSEDSDAGLDALASDAASLVDSLEDPLSPRLAALRRAPATPPTPPTPAPPEAFFVPIRDDVTPEGARVAEYMPERIRQRLHRRQRTRELRLESARRGRVRRLQEELQARRRERAERDARAALDALLDDVVAELTRAEARAARRDPPAPRPASTRRRERSRPDPGAPAERPPRRLYQKSEIHRGDKCIEILEILEYSRSSSDGAPAEERARARRSRIPVPVPDHMRLTGGDASPLARLLLRALAPPAPAPAPAPAPRDRSNSLRFRGIFDMIPEERASLSLESSADAEETDGGRRASAPAVAPAPTRSAGTSPPAAAQRSQTTMTSPGNRSAATSPWRAPPPPPPREGPREARSPQRPPRRGAPPQRETWRRSGAARGAAGERESSSSGDSGSSLLCSLAPRWLSAHARQRRRARRPPDSRPAPGGWSVTVAGSCRSALPADVEMRLRFPQEGAGAAPAPAPAPHDRDHGSSSRAQSRQECSCSSCCPPQPVPAPAPALPPPHRDRPTLPLKKEAHDSSIVRLGRRSSSGALPELGGRTSRAPSVKTRRGYSLHCWLPAAERDAPVRVNNGLSVLGCAIIPELKPRVPTMSERDLTRVYTPRHYLRS